MIVTLKDRTGYVYGYAEFEVVDAFGQFKEEGEFLYIQEIWVHDHYRRSQAMKELITMMDKDPFTKNCDWVYWNRTKYNDRQSNTYRRDRLSKMGVENGEIKKFHTAAC